MKIILPY